MRRPAPTRREFLARTAAVSAAGLIAGCGADHESPGDSRASPTATTRPPTESPFPTPTRTATPTPPASFSPPDDCPAEPGVSEPDRDDLPDLLASPPSFDDPEAVVSFVEAYEIAYMWEGWSDYGEEVPEFHVAMAPEVVKTRDNGAIVQSDYSRAHGKADHNGDGTAGHFDGGRYAFRYLVTTDAVWRVAEKKEPYGPVPELDVREEGEVLVCFREGETP